MAAKVLTELSNDLKAFGQKAKKQVTEIKRETARRALAGVIMRSPVHAGDYVKSNRVGITTKSSGRGVGLGYHPITPNKWLMSKHPQPWKLKMDLYKKKKLRISAAKFEDTIVIYNNIPYADQVEFIGWELTPAYHPFGHTINLMNIQFPIIVKTGGTTA
jgi:hypothetical protein